MDNPVVPDVFSQGFRTSEEQNHRLSLSVRLKRWGTGTSVIGFLRAFGTGHFGEVRMRSQGCPAKKENACPARLAPDQRSRSRAVGLPPERYVTSGGGRRDL